MQNTFSDQTWHSSASIVRNARPSHYGLEWHRIPMAVQTTRQRCCCLSKTRYGDDATQTAMPTCTPQPRTCHGIVPATITQAGRGYPIRRWVCWVGWSRWVGGWVGGCTRKAGEYTLASDITFQDVSRLVRLHVQIIITRRRKIEHCKSRFRPPTSCA